MTAALPVPAGQEQAARDGGGRFVAGRSGNPRGRPLGRRNHATELVERIVGDSSEKLAQRAVAMALAGDASVMRALLDRLSPAARSRAVRLDLPPLDCPENLLRAHDQVMAAVADGVITIEEGDGLAKLIDSRARLQTTLELSDRVAALELQSR